MKPYLLKYVEIDRNMQRGLTGILLCAMILTGCRAGKPAVESQINDSGRAENKEVNFSEPDTWLLGYINAAQFSSPPHSEWFTKGFDNYLPVQEVITQLSRIDKEAISIKIVLGTWCPDSRREVPRFMKIMDLWQFPVGKVVFVGVDNTKIAPIGGYDTLQIERVPTFIIMHNKVETGRIIENPVTSLEQDMLNILTRNEK